MKNQKNLFYLLLAFVPSISNIINTGSMPLQMPTNFQMPQDAEIPSIEELFGNMTEEQIVQQVQEAEKLLNSLSAEERAEWDKMVEEFYTQMPDKDKEAIHDISNMVKESPYFPKVEEPVVAEEPVKKKTADVVVDNNSVQALIDNINRQIDDIYQKASSSKDLTEEFSAKWASKITFENLKRQILALKEDRLSKKLTLKANPEDKELVEALEQFYKNIKSKNDDFFVEDTFGLPASSKKQDAQQLKQAKEILAVFDDAIETVMPKIEKFLKKHDPEALEMAKEAGERSKKAIAHAKDASIKRGSAAAPIAPEPTRKSQTPAATSSAPAYYDNYGGGYSGNNYGNYGGGYGGGYDSFDNSSPSKSAGKDSSTAPKDAKKDEPKKDDVKKEEKKETKKVVTPYDEAKDTIEDYFDRFDNKQHKDFVTFLQNELPKEYPDASNHGGQVANDMTQQDWLNGVGDYKNSGFAIYTTKMNRLMNSFKANLKEAVEISDALKKNVSYMEDADLKKFAEDKRVKEIGDRMTAYTKELDNAVETIKNQYQINANNQNTPTFLNGEYLKQYAQRHDLFLKDISNFRNTIEDAQEALKSLNSKIKREKNKAKVSKEKAAQASSSRFY